MSAVVVALALGACAPAPGSTAPAASPVDRAPITGRSLPTAAVAADPSGEPGYVAATTVGPVVAHGPAGRHRIALTFDSNMTDAMLHRLDSHQVATYANPEVVDELQARHAPATFFLAGLWVARYPDLTGRIAGDPAFEIASHSMSHRGFTAHCYGLAPIPIAEMAADVERSFDVLAPFGGHQTRYFRFPGGCYDAAALQAVAPAHATVVQYDDVGADPFNDDTASIVRNVLAGAHDGAIVVLHITKGNAPHTADALPAIVDGLRAKGYELVTLSTLLNR